jgi:miniconductance mechanosensitive channel
MKETFGQSFSWIMDHPVLSQVVEVGVLALVCIVVYVLAYRLTARLVHGVAERSSASWDDELVRSGFFNRLANLAPALVAWHGVALLSGLDPAVVVVVRRVAAAFMVLMAVLALGGFLTAVDAVYAANPENRRRPIKGYFQLVKLVSAVLAGILIIATLMDRSPLIFLSGLGAMAAVLLLVFRDTLLSLVASIQLTSYDMVHVGDWIEMPTFGADGDVIDVALHTVKVQNWDKTITTIPTHRLIEGSFKNWRGMSRSGGRRIKRLILVDVNTIRFLTDEEVGRFGKFALLREYIAEKKRAIEQFNESPDRDPAVNADVRRLTNVGTFRAYIEAYLREHPRIHKGMTLMVRQLAPTSEGLPLEIYCFTNTTDWGAYEGIQADILDHVFAVVPDFGLRCFQAPAGRDLEALGQARAGSA